MGLTGLYSRVYALSSSLTLSMAVAAAGAVVALVLVRSSPQAAHRPAGAERPAGEAHERPAEAQAEAVGL